MISDLQEFIEQLLHFLFILHQYLRHSAQPALHKRLVVQDVDPHVHHSAATHGGRGGHCKVSHLEHHRHVLEINTHISRGVRFGHKEVYIGPKCDKSMIFSDLISVLGEPNVLNSDLK